MTVSERGWNSAVRELARAFDGTGLDDDRADGALLARFAADRDEAAFAALVERHGSMVRAAARSIVPTVADAEDVFQATFLILARRAGSIRSGESVAGWLYQVTRRVALRVVAETADRRRRDQAGARSSAARALGPMESTSGRNHRGSSTKNSGGSRANTARRSSCATWKP